MQKPASVSRNKDHSSMAKRRLNAARGGVVVAVEQFVVHRHRPARPFPRPALPWTTPAGKHDMPASTPVRLLTTQSRSLYLPERHHIIS
jgi:hypothetical protein